MSRAFASRGAEIRTRDLLSTQGSGGRCSEVAGSGLAPSFSGIAPPRLADAFSDVWGFCGDFHAAASRDTDVTRGSRV